MYTVLPGQSFTYTWDITEAAGPQGASKTAAGKPAASRVWAYGSHASGDGAAGLNAGLSAAAIERWAVLGARSAGYSGS